MAPEGTIARSHKYYVPNEPFDEWDDNVDLGEGRIREAEIGKARHEYYVNCIVCRVNRIETVN